MPKLTERQRRELRADIRANTLSRDQICQKYGITERQIIRYLGENNLQNKKGRSPKEHETIAVEEKVTDNTEPEERDDLSKVDLVRDHEPEPAKPAEDPKTATTTDDLELDPSKDYCAECYRNKRKTELLKGSVKCEVCGSHLQW